MTTQIPVPDYGAAREAMVESQLRPQGVTDPAVLAAMGRIEREKFLPSAVRALAYVDRAVAIGEDRLMSGPAVVGRLLTQMKPEPGQRALVVGAGTGYSVAVLAAMGLSVKGLESDAELISIARSAGVKLVQGSLELGLAGDGPYDQILIDGAVDVVPDAIVAQLADGGRLGGAINDRGVTRLVVGRKSGSAFGTLSIGDAGVPVLPGFSRPKEFVF